MTAVWTQGSTFWIETTTADVYQSVPGFTDMAPMSPTMETRDVTTLEDTAKKFAKGWIDYGDFTATLNFDPTDARHDAATGLLSKLHDTADTFKFAIGFASTPAQYMFCEGVLTNFALSVGANASITASVTVKLSGIPTWSSTAPATA